MPAMPPSLDTPELTADTAPAVEVDSDTSPWNYTVSVRSLCEFSARRVLLKSPRVGDLLRFALGSLAGATRVLADLLRGRYWR